MSLSSVKTRAWEELQLSRHIRPYRMAVIELVYTAALQPPTFRIVFSELGPNVCTSVSRAGTGTYLINITPSVFSNTANVATSSTISYNLTTVSGNYVDMYVTSMFNTASFNQIRLLTALASGVNANTNTDLIGKVMLVIKEYYG